MTAATTAKQVAAAFRLKGLTAESLAIKFLVEAVSSSPDRQLVARVLDHLSSNPPKETPVSLDSVKHALNATSTSTASAVSASSSSRQARLSFAAVVSAQQTPKLAYDPFRRTYTLCRPQSPPSMFAEPEQKVLAVKERLELARQRFLRSEAGVSGRVALTRVESLRGSQGSRYVLGVVYMTPDGAGWALEDGSGSSAVPVDISGVVQQGSEEQPLFSEGCIVVACGELVGWTFVVKGLEMPPPETREATLAAVGEQEIASDRVIGGKCAAVLVVSDVFLDKPECVEGFRELLQKLLREEEKESGVVVVLMGNFFSSAGVSMEGVKKGWEDLGRAVGPDVKERGLVQWVLVPGPGDYLGSSGCSAMPQQPLTKCGTKGFTEKVGGASCVALASNPCRLEVAGGKEIVIFRAEDLVNKLHRNAFLPARVETTADLTKKFVRTICHQAHLTPLPHGAAPTHWSYDHVLSLHPLPHLAVISDDRHGMFLHHCCGCTVVNPGSFSSHSSFLVYSPEGTGTADLLSLKRK